MQNPITVIRITQQFFYHYYSEPTEKKTFLKVLAAWFHVAAESTTINRIKQYSSFIPASVESTDDSGHKIQKKKIAFMHIHEI